MLMKEFFLGIIEDVEEETGQRSFPPLFLVAAGRLRRLRFNCRLNDRVNFIDGVFESMLFIDDALCIVEEEARSLFLVVSSCFSLGVLVSRFSIS